MKIIKCTSEHTDIRISRGELLVLNAALNEISNGLDLADFESRIGASRIYAATLLGELNSVIDKMDSSA